MVTTLEGSKFYFQIEDISIWHDTPSELLLTKSSGQDGQLCYGSEPPCAPNRHWHCHSFSGLLGRSLDNPRSCNYLRVSTVFYPYAYHAWYAKFKPHIFYSPERFSSHSFNFVLISLCGETVLCLCVYLGIFPCLAFPWLSWKASTHHFGSLWFCAECGNKESDLTIKCVCQKSDPHNYLSLSLFLIYPSFCFLVLDCCSCALLWVECYFILHLFSTPTPSPFRSQVFISYFDLLSLCFALVT